MKCERGKEVRSIGIFGGTFNPIHNGHLVFAGLILEKKGLDEILFIPCGIPPHKESGALISGKDRIRMIELAIASNPRFGVSDIELRRRGKSYSIQTVEELKKAFGPEVEFFFIIGADSLHEISTWKDIERLSELCNFVIVARSGYSLEGLCPKKLAISKEVFNKLIAGVMDILPIDISSTDIRARVREGKSIGALVARPVAEYIARKGLYK